VIHAVFRGYTKFSRLKVIITQYCEKHAYLELYLSYVKSEGAVIKYKRIGSHALRHKNLKWPLGDKDSAKATFSPRF